MKLPEEGYVWEWRAFGAISRALTEQIQAQPLRLDVNGNALSDIFGQDLYLLSPVSNHNIKLRKSLGSDWLLKFKLLVQTEARLIELYQESAKKFYRFPVASAVVKETAELLKTQLPQTNTSLEKLDMDAFVQMLKASTPVIETILIGKIRSQYQFADGWVELAEVTFPKRRTQSISLHAFERGGVENLLDELRLEENFTAMNYLEACKRWA